MDGWTHQIQTTRGRVRVTVEFPLAPGVQTHWIDYTQLYVTPQLQEYLERLRSMKEHGTVKWFDDRKGYGFLHTRTGDLFVHWRGVVGAGYRSLVAGDRVSFFRREGVRGDEAVEVELLPSDAAHELSLADPHPAT